MRQDSPLFRSCLVFLLTIACVLSTMPTGITQDTVTGAFEGTVTNSLTGVVVPAATVQIINQQTGQIITKSSDARGRFYQGLLSAGIYTLRVSAPGFQTREVRQRLFITRTGEVVPVPVSLDPASPAAATPATATPTPAPQTEVDTDIRARINASDGERSGSFTEEEVSTLPLGATTVVRSFDELTLLLPGVAPPPQTLGSVAGPGVGAGVGSSGQFSVNGLRSRANNFTMDGSDNNDEDIGVRRQGFVSLVSQPIESVKEYQAITLLAPAQFGRNIGAQVNAVSKSGGNETHGTIYGFLNSSQLNSRNFFDTTFGNAASPLRAGNNQPVLLADDITINNARIVPVNPRPLTVRNESGDEDSFTIAQGGFVLGGPIKRERVFYFIAAERQQLNATKEESFAVPTVEQRGAFNSGATGQFMNPFRRNGTGNAPIFDPVLTQPTTPGGDAVFSLFPFPNNPQGIYGANTLTQALPASGHGTVLSAKVDGNFKLKGRQQSLTNRYNFTDDERIIPVTSNAIFSSLKPRVRTQNNSLFFNSEVSAPDSARPMYNQVRLSYGRTRLVFDEARDTSFLSPGFPSGKPFILNAPLISNRTLPDPVIVDNAVRIGANTGPIIYTPIPCQPPPGLNISTGTVECLLGPVGQVNIAGFNPVGVDVFDFPQSRVNNTYQVADNLTWRVGAHSLAFGTDLRRTELNSALERNARALITFSGAPLINLDIEPGTGNITNIAPGNNFIRPETLAAASAASGFAQTFSRDGGAGINLRFYQLDFYAQDTWRVSPQLSLSYGLRYEYNTPPRETSNRIEDTFNDPSLALIPGLRTFIGDRTSIFDPDRNNFAPRLGAAYTPNLFGRDRLTVVRGGYGIFYDQILGAVVSQSRNVYPNFVTFDRAGGFSNRRFLGQCPEELSRNNCGFELTPPFLSGPRDRPIVVPGSLNTLSPNFSFEQLVQLFNTFSTANSLIPPLNGFSFTIPRQQLEMPLAHHYSISFEQQLRRNLVVSAAYAGTSGRNLLRFTTPNLGRNAFLAPVSFTGGGLGGPATNSPFVGDPVFFGFALPPGTRIAPDGRGFTGGRPVSGIGHVIQYETTARSRYDSLQLQLRGRLQRALQFQVAYTFSKASDDVSDTFDLAGAPALPQNSFTFEGEYARANYDVPHRLTYNFIYELPDYSNRGRALRFFFSRVQLAGLGKLRSGQPFTVNSIFDVNLDGNLTDRLNSTGGIVVTGDRRQPLRLTSNNTFSLLAPITQDGQIGRNTFRAGNVVELDMSLTKTFALSERQRLLLRVDVFNVINRANFGIPVRFLEAPAFGQAISTITPPRRVQLALKYSF